MFACVISSKELEVKGVVVSKIWRMFRRFFGAEWNYYVETGRDWRPYEARALLEDIGFDRHKVEVGVPVVLEIFREYGIRRLRDYERLKENAGRYAEFIGEVYLRVVNRAYGV